MRTQCLLEGGVPSYLCISTAGEIARIEMIGMHVPAIVIAIVQEQGSEVEL